MKPKHLLILSVVLISLLTIGLACLRGQGAAPVARAASEGETAAEQAPGGSVSFTMGGSARTLALTSSEYSASGIRASFAETNAMGVETLGLSIQLPTTVNSGDTLLSFAWDEAANQRTIQLTLCDGGQTVTLHAGSYSIKIDSYAKAGDRYVITGSFEADVRTGDPWLDPSAITKKLTQGSFRFEFR